MKSIDIKSVLNPNRAYRLSDDWPWNARGEASIGNFTRHAEAEPIPTPAVSENLLNAVA